MTLTSGSRLGSYEILSPLGAGGMGEVYRARDSKLGRDVAVKILPDVFTKDPDRLARFEREARLLASLNHPNIGSIYGLEESDGTRFLVLELVPGETLAGMISKGPLELHDALKICRQIADALEAAHEKGIIHRDLKPANVKVTPEGMVKVLDFGLAKAFAPDESSPVLSMSPTLTVESMRTGVILGTAAYMSPEQARGKPLDKRTDIWSFGGVLYECLTGRQAFTGETVSDTMAAILRGEPDWNLVPPGTPANIQLLLHRCLQKERNVRLHDIGDARIEIDEALTHPTGAAATITSPIATGTKRRELLAWMLAAVFFLGMAMMAIPYFRGSTPEQKIGSIHFPILPPPNSTVSLGSTGSGLAISPDGRRVAFVAFVQGRSIISVRPLGSLSVQQLPGTEDALYPFWSADSAFIGFFSGGKLKKVDLSGGPPIALCDASLGLGGAWNRDGVILFAPKYQDALYRVSAAGGAPKPVSTLDPAHQEFGHYLPCFLPDGIHFLYLSRSVSTQEDRTLCVGSLDGKEIKRLFHADSNALYSPPGYLLFVRERTLVAQPFDAKRLETKGEAFPIADQVGVQAQYRQGAFSVSENGVLAYGSGSGRGFQLAWYDRTGKQLALLGEPATYRAPALSPDEKRVAVEKIDPQTGTGDIWLFELARGGAPSRFTFDPAADSGPVWSPDGSRILFASSREGAPNLYQKSSSGAGKDELVFKSNSTKTPTDWSRDGKFILYESLEPKTKYDLWVLPLVGDRKPIPFLQAEFDERRGMFSPDGRWIAYVSNETGSNEVYVQTFPPSGGKWQVSTHGGDQPVWRGDGKELFYLAADRKLMSVEVNTASANFEAGIPKPLFETRISSVVAYRNYYCATRDGQRFLIYSPVQEAIPLPITVVVNWTEDLKH